MNTFLLILAIVSALAFFGMLGYGIYRFAKGFEAFINWIAGN